MIVSFRLWAIKYEHNDVKVSARECHDLFKIEVRINEAGDVEFSYPGIEKLVLPLVNTSSKSTKVHIFGEDVASTDCGDAAARWVSSDYLRANLDLVDKNRRKELSNGDCTKTSSLTQGGGLGVPI